MITVKKLRELLEQIPDDARAYACEAEQTGLWIVHGRSSWWIQAYQDEEEDYNGDFKEEVEWTPSRKIVN